MAITIDDKYQHTKFGREFRDWASKLRHVTGSQWFDGAHGLAVSRPPDKADDQGWAPGRSGKAMTGNQGAACPEAQPFAGTVHRQKQHVTQTGREAPAYRSSFSAVSNRRSVVALHGNEA